METEVKQTIKFKTLKRIKHFRKRTQDISILAHDIYYVEGDSSCLEVFDDLAQNEHINAIGVVNNDNIEGIIIKKNFFSYLSRPFTRDLMKNKSISFLAEKAVLIPYHKNIFIVAEELKNEINGNEILYFILATDDNHFAGIFSTRDMLIHLSSITQSDIEMARLLQTRIVKENNSVIIQVRFIFD